MTCRRCSPFLAASVQTKKTIFRRAILSAIFLLFFLTTAHSLWCTRSCPLAQVCLRDSRRHQVLGDRRGVGGWRGVTMRAPQVLELAYHHRGGFHALKHLVLVREIELMDAAFEGPAVEGSRHSRRTAARAPRLATTSRFQKDEDVEAFARYSSPHTCALSRLGSSAGTLGFRYQAQDREFAASGSVHVRTLTPSFFFS